MAGYRKERPPAYNPDCNTYTCSGDTRQGAYPAVNGRHSPPPYCEDVNYPRIDRSRKCDSLPSRSRRRVRSALSNVSQNNEVAVSDRTSGFINDGNDRLQRRSNSVGKGHRRRFQFDATGRERRKRPVDMSTTAPALPARQLPGEPIGSPIKCVQRFDVYNSEDIAGSGHHTLMCIDISETGNILIIDSHSMLVHVLSNLRVHLCPAFRVLGVHGGCFWKEDKLVLATHRGLKLCQLDGSAEKDYVIGHIVCTKRYKLGFVAAERQRLTMYGGLSSKVTAGATVTKVRSGSFIKRGKSFVEIADVAVNNDVFVVLDIGRNVIYRIDERGRKISKIVPNVHTCGAIQFAPSVVIDSHSIIVCDANHKRLLKLQSDGKFVNCLLNFSVQVAGVDVDGVPLLHGIALTSLGQLFVTLSGNDIAEVRVYEL